MDKIVKVETQVFKTLFAQGMLEEGFLASTGYCAALAHKEPDVNLYLETAQRVFFKMKDAVAGGNPEKHPGGPVSCSGLKQRASDSWT